MIKYTILYKSRIKTDGEMLSLKLINLLNVKNLVNSDKSFAFLFEIYSLTYQLDFD